MVYTLRVPLDRAVWCIRAIGGTEVVSDISSTSNETSLKPLSE